MGDVGKGGDGAGGNGVGAGYAIQGSCAVSVIIWERYLGGDEGDAKSTSGILSSVSKEDYGDYSAAYNERRVGVAPVG